MKVLRPQDFPTSSVIKAQLVKQYGIVSRFLLTPQAQKKANKENAVRKISRSAEREEGYAPSTAQAFKKA